jgi:uncharacterized protein YndB with AHSA1/START domain
MTDDSSSRDALVIERTFDAPVERVWQLWTDPEQFKQWYGPDGVSIPVATMDVRVGGTRLLCMEMDTPDGLRQMWFAGEYREVVVNERLVYTDFMSDRSGTELPAAQPGHPSTTEVRVELTDLGDRTRMVLTHVGIAADSPGAVGWAMALDKLAEHGAARSDR